MTGGVQQFDVVIPVDTYINYTPPFVPGEMLAVQFNVERPTTTGGTLTATPQHSPDGGRNWVDKTALTLTSSGAFAANAITALYGSDATTPHHPLYRLMLSTTVSSTVRVLVKARGRRRARQRLVYDGIVPTNDLYTAPFDLSPSSQTATIHAIGIPVGSNTSPTLTVQLELTHDGNHWGNQVTTAEINAQAMSANRETVMPATLDVSRAKGNRARFRVASGSGAATNATHVRIYLTEWEGSRSPLPSPMLDDTDDMDIAEMEEDEDDIRAMGRRAAPKLLAPQPAGLATASAIGSVTPLASLRRR